MTKIPAKKSLGQNFLKDENVLKKIANTIEKNENYIIIEIGPGTGALTKYLVQKKGKLICYEIDERMKDILQKYENENTKVIFQDFLQRNIKEDLPASYENIYIIANIPYYITTPIIEHIIKCDIKEKAMTLLVQKEVGYRFSAQPKSKDYGYFTVLLNHYYEVNYLFDVSRKSFDPSPNVDSAVITFERKENSIDLDMPRFQKFLKQCFLQKRKKLKNNLPKESWPLMLEILKINGYDENVRAEDIPYEMFVELFKGLCQIFRPLFGRVSELEMDFSKLSGDKYPIEE